MADIALPFGPARSLEVGPLRELVFDALIAGARDLAGTIVHERQIVLQRPIKGMSARTGKRLSVPDYRRSILDAAGPQVIASVEARALTAFIWDAGGPPRMLSRDGDVAPGRDSWEWWTWSDLVREPLQYLLATSAIRDLTQSRTYRQWHIDVDEARDAALEVAKVTTGRRRSVRALSPLIRVSVPEGFSETLAPGIALRAWSLDEESLFLNRFGHEYHPDDKAAGMSDALLDLNLPDVGRDDDEIAEAVVAVVDRVKWSLMAASDADRSFTEGAIILRSPSGWKGTTIRRQDTLFKPGAYRRLSLTEEAVDKAARLLERAGKLAKRARGFGKAVGFLGRSLNAVTERDSLLEAAIGLESLLVKGGRGDLSYRFRLHGAALLSHLAINDVYDVLEEIYNLRSGAAHGEERGENTLPQVAEQSRSLLARALVAVLDLCDSGELDLKKHGGEIGVALGALVRARCTRAQR